ncbi:protein phosphatase 2C domain-containing protein [Nocardia seriolae]|uniref:Protein phosphatase 2C domain-containing protein n=1 Tax=Nocardia seriolae TaxID=37332 RepID=A0A0B8NEJ2_9NOCA|nr:protein phosphatase 2C domain-containing protein [Nocardia seriolae]MTJ60572.1 hypothetical protein [Nocardia seriolae]MTJ76526.1 hypothetical protein [Nocardia seriolae]MTJ84545.1 hypothetical protein [Nocardia seriolae]MTK28532.1 hypothetical protein [Nocardia seriolae]MTK38556.1 hypothetical protein [Nocardia seriolae]
MSFARVATAQLPAKSNEDRLVITAEMVIILDGATTYGIQNKISGGTFAERLGAVLVRIADESASLSALLEVALQYVISDLELPIESPNAPSSTIAIVRKRRGTLDFLVLGDSTIVLGYRDGAVETICDERLEQLGLVQSRKYRSRLQQGGGYDDRHREILAELQQEQRRRRNRPGGYWIASTAPEAAQHAIIAARPVADIAWVALATDGVTDLIDALKVDWQEIGSMDSAKLSALLARIHRWEYEVDPDGILVPRSKRHDDKAIAVVRL